MPMPKEAQIADLEWVIEDARKRLAGQIERNSRHAAHGTLDYLINMQQALYDLKYAHNQGPQ